MMPAMARMVRNAFGLRYQVASAVDLKWMVFAPRINGNDDPRVFGAGMGV